MVRNAGIESYLAHYDPQYSSSSRKQHAGDCRRHHGLELLAIRNANGFISAALEAAADSGALKQARRFAFRARQRIYRAGALSRNALQLTESFPALALAIYGGRYASLTDSLEIGVERTATIMVERGAPLRQVAELIGLPFALRKVKPGAANLALAIHRDLFLDPRLIDAYMPDTQPAMKRWLGIVARASQVGPDFAEWGAKNALGIGIAELVDIGDWVKAGRQARRPPFGVAVPSIGEEFVTRPFTPQMSLKTVVELSSEWHGAVAANMTGPSYEFPEPWCDAGQSGEYEIVPIRNAADLYQEGRVMHHCVGTYSDRVRRGEVYIYSIRRDGMREATLGLSKDRERVVLSELRGRCNSVVPRKIVTAARKWLRAQKQSAPRHMESRVSAEVVAAPMLVNVSSPRITSPAHARTLAEELDDIA
jgi:hypothetical protein